MGGLEIDADSRVVKKVGANMVPINGLYAAGEIAGGVHGNNRLGGNSLLDCVVFGRVAGKHAAQYVMGETIPTFLSELSGAMGASGGAAEAAAPAAPAAGGGAPAGGLTAPLLPKVGQGKDDAKIWGNYPHTTHLSWITAIYLMVMSFLKEIVFTIFSTIPIKVTYSGNVSTTGKVMGLLWVVCLCCAVFLESVLFFAALCCCAVVFSCLSVCLDREEELSTFRTKLLEP
jgi:hypothetical protein